MVENQQLLSQLFTDWNVQHSFELLLNCFSKMFSATLYFPILSRLKMIISSVFFKLYLIIQNLLLSYAFYSLIIIIIITTNYCSLFLSPDDGSDNLSIIITIYFSITTSTTSIIG